MALHSGNLTQLSINASKPIAPLTFFNVVINVMGYTLPVGWRIGLFIEDVWLYFNNLSIV